MSIAEARARIDAACRLEELHDDPLLLPYLQANDAALVAMEGLVERVERALDGAASEVGRKAALGAQQHARALVRSELRKSAIWLAGLFTLAVLTGAGVGWMLAQ